ncbi:MAG TPA: non-homologous end-joining DNA ligase [Candidatus Acidoferrales bacterium]|nr:non-homologous end-joining DNA ligase [Candidatus Acidoferrales bacterium]
MKRAKLRVGGRELELSNLDKLMYPEAGFTKAHVIDYYRRVSRYLLPHVKNRPITLKRFPDGVRGESFYEKNAPSFTPAWVKTFAISRTGGESAIRYILINDLPTLVWSANLANLEIHPFLAKAPRIDVPTMIVFDLDPGEGASVLHSCEVALLVKEVLDRLGLESFVKVSGSKGIHLHVPLNTPVTYEMTQALARSIARFLEKEHPELIVSDMAKAKRKKKVLVDWSQNSEHKSTVAVYSLRAKAERPFVALPLAWAELKDALEKGDASALFFEPDAALNKLAETGDLFAPLSKLKQRLPKAFREIASEDGASGSLEKYRQKRNFAKTPEPQATGARLSRQGMRRLFVVQKHAASRLHYDLRLQMQGVLKSWAVPKGPPYDINERRLAMATEDHPLEYARFEGTIPQAEYGGGTVMVWDIGTYELLDGNYGEGKLRFFLRGKKLNGEWVLVRARERNGSDNRWYWMKAATPATRPRGDEEDRSALSGRSLEQIKNARAAVWHSNRGRRQGRNAGAAVDLERLPEARLEFIEPMLAKPVGALPEDAERWLYEIKLDGYRCLAARDENGVTLFSRNRKLLNGRFPVIARALEKLDPGVFIDGEIVALDKSGRPSFTLLQNYRAPAELYFYAFDLLAYRHRSLLQVPLEKRRDLLETMIAPHLDRIRLSETFASTAAEIVRAARQLGLEGVIAKRRDSLYEPGQRSGAWVKYRINKGQEFVVGGYVPGAHYFDSLLVGYYESDRLLFVAKIRNGFVPRTRREVFARFKGLETERCPFANLPEAKGARRAMALTAEAMKRCRWLRPELVAEIEFTEWTADNRLRHARFAGLRDDKKARDVVREEQAAWARETSES